MKNKLIERLEKRSDNIWEFLNPKMKELHQNGMDKLESGEYSLYQYNKFCERHNLLPF